MMGMSEAGPRGDVALLVDIWCSLGSGSVEPSALALSTVPVDKPWVIGARKGIALCAVTEADCARRRDDEVMTSNVKAFVERRGRPTAIVVFVAIANTLAFAVGIADEARLRSIGRTDLSAPVTVLAAFAVMLVSTCLVGGSVVIRRPDHPVGWLLLGLGFSVAVSVPIDAYSLEGLVVSPGSLPGADVVAVVGSLTFVPWLVLVAAVLHLTPTGRPVSRRFGTLLRATVVAAFVTIAAALFSDRKLDHPYEGVRNPMAAGPLGGPLRTTGMVAASVLGLGVLVSIWSLIVRFRRAQGTERLQLLWFAILAVPMPVLLAGAFVTARTGSGVGPFLFTAPLIALLPTAAGLGISRYRLFDVERLLSKVLAHTLLSGLLVMVFLAITVSIGAVFGRSRADSPVSVAIATVAAVVVFTPARRWLQDRLDRRFDRRRHDALAVLQRHLDAATPITDVTRVLREALGDDSLNVLFPVEDGNPSQPRWVDAEGVANDEPPNGDEVRRGTRVIARVVYDSDQVERRLANAVFAAAATELDNAALRAELAVRLVEVRQSRSRLVGAQHEERRRIERNLHDGAQQRLLALAMQLQAAAMNGNDERLRDAAAVAIAEARRAVEELRELANGLRPSVLADGGLSAALEDLAARSTVPVTIAASDQRFAPEVEETAWFIACEALANVHKHADASQVDITAQMSGGALELTVSDNGRGGADPSGRGLMGLHDRVDAMGGSLRICSEHNGTSIEARIPCGS